VGVRSAAAGRQTVLWTKAGGRLALEVSDDGIGGAHIDLGTGRRGLTDRLAALEGRLDIDSKPGLGTTVRASILCP
jgi:signal transduction histidine kinase